MSGEVYAVKKMKKKFSSKTKKRELNITSGKKGHNEKRQNDDQSPFLLAARVTDVPSSVAALFNMTQTAGC